MLPQTHTSKYSANKPHMNCTDKSMQTIPSFPSLKTIDLELTKQKIFKIPPVTNKALKEDEDEAQLEFC